MVSGHPQSRSPVAPAATAELRRPLLAVAAVTLVMALPALNARATYGAQVTADEPQYLLTALSLAEDRSLDISDEIDEQRFLDFHEVALNPQTTELNADGQRLSPHDPGLPLLLAGPMGLGGWRAAKLALAVLAAATAAMTCWVAVRRFDVSVRTAVAITIALFVTPPLTGYATQVYPEMAAALATIIAFAAVTERSLSTAGRMVAAAAIVALPWLAIKYVPVAAVLGAGLLVAVVRANADRVTRLRTVGPLLLGFALMGGLYLLFHQRVYGGWTVYASGDHFVDGEFLVVGDQPDYPGRSRRLIGLLVDRGFGLVAWAPAFVLLVPSLAALARRRPRGWALLAAALGAGWATATWVALTMHGWWWPGRQLVVVLPLAVVAMAVLADQHRIVHRLMIGASLLAVVNWLWLVIESSTGRRTLIVDFTDTTSPLYRLWSTLLPDHRSIGWLDIVLTVVWTVGLAWLATLAWRQARPSEHAR